MKTQHTSVAVFRIVILTTIFICLLIGCDSSDPMLDIGLVEEGSTNSLLAPRNPESYMVYIQPDDTDYHLMNIPCLESGRTVVTEAEALEQGHTPCEVCFPPPPEPVELNVYILSKGTDYHRSNCRYLDGTQTVISMAVAVDEGVLPCPDCYSELAALQPLNVWATPETELYHREYCPNLTDNKVLMPLTEAQESGYTPDPICYWQTERIIKKGVRIDRINSVVDPFGDDSDNELIVLKNLDGFSHNIGGWTLSDGEPRGVYVIPEETTITAYETWSVARSQYNPTNDTKALYLNNQHDSLSLQNDKGQLIDVWRW